MDAKTPHSSPKPSVEILENDSRPMQQLDFEENTPAEKKLLRKIDLFLLPAAWIIYLLSYMDRSNIGNARVAGMGDALDIDDNRYYLAVVLFQIGYVVAEVPSNIILSATRPSLFIPAIMTRQQLVGMRFLLGIAEAGFSPALMFLISSWYRRHEQSKRFVVFHSAGIFSGAFGSIIAGAITDRLDGRHGIAGWRWLFIIEGVLTVAVAVFIPFVLLDYPLTSKRLSPEERQLAYDRLCADGITSRNDSREHYLIAGYITIIRSMSLVYFYPGMVEELGYNSNKAQYMTAPLYSIALAIAIPLYIIADRYPQYQGFYASSVLLVFGTIMSAVASRIHAPTARYVLLCFINTAVWSHIHERAISLAVINGCANLAQLYGTDIFTVSEAPEYVMGFAAYSAVFAVGAMIYLAGHFVYRKWPYKVMEAM
ncbi:major facilitator superfamily domain-containing protein [Aspergillus karnatakaensis]|uniref:major facilitator superfamily domain-containing protein n=1 Tax=Aspergillus karnatakaensis TaxID=1810916 RepID=UPI003CCE1872